MVTNGSSPGALVGYRVLDFGWIIAGSFPGTMLADMGAEVIKVESRTRMDVMRQGRPIIPTKKGERDYEQNPMHHNYNRSKRSLTLNLGKPESREVIRRIAQKSDIVSENFAPGVMEKLGMGYEWFRRIREDIVMVSLHTAFSGGPLGNLRGGAPTVAALSGIDAMLGYPGGRPIGLKQYYGDLCGALNAYLGVVSALYCRERTGKGQHVEISLLNATMANIGAQYLYYDSTGRSPEPRGNFDPVMAPYNNFHVQGDDKWVSIAVESDKEWQGLCEVLAIDEEVRYRFADRASRLMNRTEVEAAVAERTPSWDGWELTSSLQAVGVAAFPLLSPEERYFDQHYKERGLYEEVEHPSLGVEPVFNLMWKMSETPPAIRGHAPIMGQDNRYVLHDVAEFSEAEIEAMERNMVLQ